MHKARLTDLSIRALQPPEKGHAIAWDDAIPGFGVRTSRGGTKSFFLMYGRERKRFQIGRVGIISLQDARSAAKKFLAERTLGKREAPAFTFPDAIKLFLETQDHLAPITVRDYQRLLKTRFEKPLRHLSLGEIQTHHIVTILDGLSHIPAERKYAHSVIRRFFSWAAGRRYIERSPIELLDVPKPTKPRERVLSEAELKAVWNAAAAMRTHFGAVVRIAILTGQRRGAIAALQEEWIDRANLTISWPAASTKQKKPHRIPIGKMCLPLIPQGRGYLFKGKGKDTPINGWSKSTAALIKEAKVNHFVLHDLRRTCSTMWSQMRIDRDTREFLLGHSLQGIEGVYDHWDRMEAMRDAIEKWEAHLATILK